VLHYSGKQEVERRKFAYDFETRFLFQINPSRYCVDCKDGGT
jgi:hypothetical protein